MENFLYETLEGKHFVNFICYLLLSTIRFEIKQNLSVHLLQYEFEYNNERTIVAITKQQPFYTYSKTKNQTLK